MNKQPTPKSAFVMPHFSDDFKTTKPWLIAAIKSILNQTDQDFLLIIIDDASPSKKAKTYLRQLAINNKCITVIFNLSNKGAGFCRNLGIALANKMDCDIILFQDADDISHPNRLKKCRAVFDKNPPIDVIYSTFKSIDEQGKRINTSALTPSIAEILAAHKKPPTGMDVWKTIATTTGYINLTSTTAVRTELALSVKFPNYHVSEDYHTWLRYSAVGGYFHFIQSIPSDYRIAQNVAGSASRKRHPNFYQEKMRVDTEAIIQSIEIAKQKHQLSKAEGDKILALFFGRLAETMSKEKEFELMDFCLKEARKVYPKDNQPVIPNEKTNLDSLSP